MSNIYRLPTWEDTLQANNTTGTAAIFNTNVVCNFGSTSQAGIQYDGTNLIINPKLSGSGYIDTSGGSLSVNTIGIGSQVPSSTSLIFLGAVTDATLTNVINASLTHSGAGSSLRALAFTMNAGGTANSPGPSSFCISNLAANVTPAAASNPTIVGFLGQAATTVKQTVAAGQTKTITVKGLTGNAPGDALGHDATGGTIVFRRYSLIVSAPGALTGTTGITDTSWCGLFESDVQINTGGMLILEGSDTVKGDSGFIFDTTTANKIQVKIDNVVAFDVRQITMNLADPYDIVIGTTTGTKIGTGSTQKIGFWGHAPAARPAAYTVTNPTVNRSLNETTATLAQVAQVLGTLITDLQGIGLVG